MIKMIFAGNTYGLCFKNIRRAVYTASTISCSFIIASYFVEFFTIAMKLSDKCFPRSSGKRAVFFYFYIKRYVSNHWCRLLLCIKENANKADPHWLCFAMSVFISKFPFNGSKETCLNKSVSMKVSVVHDKRCSY